MKAKKVHEAFSRGEDPLKTMDVGFDNIPKDQICGMLAEDLKQYNIGSEIDAYENKEEVEGWGWDWDTYKDSMQGWFWVGLEHISEDDEDNYERRHLILTWDRGHTWSLKISDDRGSEDERDEATIEVDNIPFERVAKEAAKLLVEFEERHVAISKRNYERAKKEMNRVKKVLKV